MLLCHQRFDFCYKYEMKESQLIPKQCNMYQSAGVMIVKKLSGSSKYIKNLTLAKNSLKPVKSSVTS